MCRSKPFRTLGYSSFAIGLTLVGCALSPEPQNNTAEPASAPLPPLIRSAVSGLPVPDSLRNPPLASPQAEGDLPLTDPSLVVLDWAGFEAAATYSFDDGQPSHITHWEALKETGVPMTWYLCSSMSQSPSKDRVWKDASAQGHELGNHTKSHKKIADYPDNSSIIQDIDDCAAYLSERLGQTKTPSFAYPFGETTWKDFFDSSSDDDEDKAPRFLLARTVYGGRVSARASIDPLLLPTFAVSGNHDEKDFIRELDAALRSKSWTIFMYHSILPGENWYAGVSIDSILESLNHARRSQKIWLDTVEAIGSYWFAARIFRETSPSSYENGLRWDWDLPVGFNPGHYLRVSIDGGTISQNGQALPRHEAGFYEIALDARSLIWTP